jgi:hypothetical protein
MTIVRAPSGRAESEFVKYVSNRFYHRNTFTDGILNIELTEKTNLKSLIEKFTKNRMMTTIKSM